MKTHLLCLETSGKNCSVALTQNDSILAHRSICTGSFSHAENLHLFIEQVIQEAELSLSDITAVSLSQGPGSYTGLRIGTSTAKGLCFALQIPLITVSSLEVLTRQVSFDGYIVPMFDARRMEVYTAVFNAHYQQVTPTKALVLDTHSFSDLKSDKVLFLGDGSEKFSAICTHKKASFIPRIFPDAKNMGAISYEKLTRKDFTDVAYFEPDYLKPFHAG